MKLSKALKHSNIGSHAAVVNVSDLDSPIKIGQTVMVPDSWVARWVPAVVTEVEPERLHFFKDKNKKLQSTRLIMFRVKKKSVNGAWRRETWAGWYPEGENANVRLIG